MGTEKSYWQLETLRRKLKREIIHAMIDYREYQEYYVGVTPEEADNKYYIVKFIESGYDSEGNLNKSNQQGSRKLYRVGKLKNK